MQTLTNRYGFSLLEATIALAIVSVTAVASLSSLSAIHRAEDAARRMTLLATLAAQVMDERIVAGPETSPEGWLTPAFPNVWWQHRQYALSPDLIRHTVQLTDGEKSMTLTRIASR